MANEFIIRKGYKSFSDSQITGSLSVSNAVTASFFTGSFRGDGSELTGIDGFPFTGSASISGSLTIVGPVTATEFIGNGSQLTGIDGFPFTGSAIISGSLQVTGSISTDTDAIINSLTVGKGGGNLENNTVLGYEALISNVEGEGNVAVGYKALSSSLAGMGPNTAVGNQALRDNVYGFRNTAIGSATLLSNDDGIFNTAVGHNALVNNIDGSYNNAVGDGALSENTSGDNNIAIGHDALHDNTEGDNNVSIGNSSLYNNITGSNNTAIGTDAGQYAGASVTSLTSVDNSIFIGYQSRALNAVGDTNEIVIGHNIVGLGSNTTVIGNNNTVSTTLKGAVSASLFSGSFAGDGSQLTGIDGFPFTGSAAITGSLTVAGPVNATSFTGSIRGTATTASYVNIANVDGFTAYSSSVNTAIGSVLDATTPITATINNTNSPFTITNQTIVIVDSTNGNVTVNLPNLNTVVGTPNQKPIVVYKNDYSQNVIFVSPSGSQLINGASQDIIVSIQLAVIYNPTSAGWVTEGTSAQSLAELELFFVPRTETGSLSVATASYVEYADVVNKPTLVSGSSQISFTGITNKPTLVSGSSQISFTGITGKPTLVSGSSQVTYSGIVNKPSGIVSSSVQVKEYNVFATTGSNQFNGNQSITGSLTVSGQVVAQTLNVQQVTSSIVYSSGSNIFGNNSGNTHRFTGSLGVTGSLTVSGTGTFSNSIYGTNALFGSAFLSNETSKIGIGFESGYGLVNSWGANTSTFGGLKFQINASNGNTFNAITIAPSGFVGIGTNASLPYGRLEVADVSQLTNAGQWASATISMKQVSGVIGNYSQIVFGYHSNTQTNGSAYIGYVATNQGTNGYGDLVFGTRAVNTDTQPTERMRITSGGSVGIGIDNPSTFLHVFGSNTANRGQLSIQSNNASNGARATWYYDTTLQGEIGTTSGDFYALAVNNFLFYTGGNPRMTITSNGNIGFGITPAAWGVGNNYTGYQFKNASLYVRTSSPELYLNNNSYYNGTNWKYLIEAPAAKFELINNEFLFSNVVSGTADANITWVDRMQITSGGVVSINGGLTTYHQVAIKSNSTNSYGGLAVYPTSGDRFINVQHTGAQGFIEVDYAGSSGFSDLVFRTGGNPRITVTSGGNVLIGTTSNIASSKLRVNGNIQIEGFQKMYTYYIEVQPNTTGTITISSPTGTFMQGSMQVIAGGYGNSLSGNVTGLWMVGGLLFFNNASTSTITQIVNSVTADGSMSFQRSSDQYTVTLANTSSLYPKTFYVSVIINGD